MYFRSVFFILLLVSAYSQAETNERFWVVFAGGYLMQIDSLGNVILPPSRIQGVGPRINGAPAISHNGPDALNLWFLSSYNGQVYRAIVDKRTLKTIKVVRTMLRGHNFSSNYLNATDRSMSNFISLPVDTNLGVRIAGYPVMPQGQVLGKRWFLSPVFNSICKPFEGNCTGVGGITSNGHLTYWIDVNSTNVRKLDLFIRLLGPQGKPIKNAVLIDSITSPFFIRSWIRYPVSTATLPGNKRFLVYIRAHPHGFAFAKPHRLMIQQIDAVLGIKIGNSIELHRNKEIFPNVKIDLSGRFVLFSLGSDEDGSGKEGLAYLPLTSEGKPSGRPKIISYLSGMIDLVKDRF